MKIYMDREDIALLLEKNVSIENHSSDHFVLRSVLPEELQKIPDKLYDRILMVCSYIASMSDGYAIVLHKKIKGDLI